MEASLPAAPYEAAHLTAPCHAVSNGYSEGPLSKEFRDAACPAPADACQSSSPAAAQLLTCCPSNYSALVPSIEDLTPSIEDPTPSIEDPITLAPCSPLITSR